MKISPDWFRFCYLRLLLMVVVWLSWPFRPLDNPKGFLSLNGDVFSGIVTQDRFDFSIFEILGFLSPAIPTSDLLGSTSRYNRKGFPLLVSGVPPDAFSETGQLWDSPLYDWKAVEEDRFSWWVRHLKRAQDLFDEFRTDHFRGFSGFWVVPSGAGGVFVDAAVAGAAPASAAPAMVKPLNMSEVLDASKEKMFASIVPDSSAKVLSRYTEMVDDIIRTQAEKLQQRSELALGVSQGNGLARFDSCIGRTLCLANNFMGRCGSGSS
ncbi:putative 4-alpha-glucanotransferase [Helianthus annuus]|uniref:4-alpha-glucanotransferase n=1 Tax=Helianthus annuus TaxID=4232 RepID=A0A9K3H476_HELAN|nr:putative 4-alpha-glucanotransferase [Helianthus annuus]KAJ0453023.1 putative 4-alpha-glucanotransferase [Helianthus annuus]KAJ0474941.1 putative 4-alpha-glucanotransferase [Helianthus annuus]KAJ0650496.1 putative 4-alpha-glucanotransferase [Helianthus annuus]KAJ0654248.1 putative 4-alpha-glucanotransferase [Helianthus annuus]